MNKLAGSISTAERNRRRGASLARRLLVTLPEHPRAAFKRTLETGSADDAYATIEYAPGGTKQDVAVAFYLAGLHGDALGSVLSYAFKDDCAALRRVAHDQGKCLMSMFRASRFEIPADIPDPLRVWRGARNVSVETACVGLSWTDNRDIAVMYATTYGRPVVVTRTIPRSSIVFVEHTWFGPADSELTFEQRIDCEPVTGRQIIFDLPTAGVLDGEPVEWQAIAVGHQKRMSRNLIRNAEDALRS